MCNDAFMYDMTHTYVAWPSNVTCLIDSWFALTWRYISCTTAYWLSDISLVHVSNVQRCLEPFQRVVRGMIRNSALMIRVAALVYAMMRLERFVSSRWVLWLATRRAGYDDRDSWTRYERTAFVWHEAFVCVKWLTCATWFILTLCTYTLCIAKY